MLGHNPLMYEKLLEAGADVINGEVFLNRVLMGVCTKDGFVLTPEGEAWEPPAPAPRKPGRPLKYSSE
jgi:hypothetical protein